MEEMMESQLTLHLKNFNNKVKVMNQTGSKELTLTKLEAQNLHNDIFELLAQIAELAAIRTESLPEEVVSVEMDGGKF